MKEYPKIQSIFKRDEQTHKFIEGKFSLPEFEYLQNNIWVCTEKVDGTNIRVIWEPKPLVPICHPLPKKKVIFQGKTNKAQIPSFLIEKLEKMFSTEKFEESFPDPEISMCLYGEGYGARIQKGGGNYIADGVDFVLFDVWIDGWWLKREDIEDVANKLGIKVVPIVGEHTLKEATTVTKIWIQSRWGDFAAEGLVLKPKVELFARNGRRIITKMKTKDFA